MTRRHRVTGHAEARLLLVDDDEALLAATGALLRTEGYEVRCCLDGASALRALETAPVDVVVLDYFMPGMTGEQFVERLRQTDPVTQVVLHTGYAGEFPGRELLSRLDIQGYVDKSEGPEQLLLWVAVAVKAALAGRQLRRSQQALQGVLLACERLHSCGSVSRLYDRILEEATRLVDATGGILAVFPDAMGEDGDLMVEESTGATAKVVASFGSLAGQRDWARTLSLMGLDVVRQSLETRAPVWNEHWVALPLAVGEQLLGFVALQRGTLLQEDAPLLEVFSRQAGAALQNAVFYEMSALDPLTGVHARRFFDAWMGRALRGSLRTGQALSLLLLDLDGLKQLNDTWGHLAGDAALAAVGKVLLGSLRGHDVVARTGGDEFAMLLPDTDLAGAERVALRLLGDVRSCSHEGRRLSVSIGVAVLEPRGACPASVGRSLSPEFFEEWRLRLVSHADAALYRAKDAGRDRLWLGRRLEVPWISTERPASLQDEELA